MIDRSRRAALLPAFFIFCALSAVFAQSQEELGAKSQQVKQLMSAGRFEEAIPLCQQLVKAVPGNAGLILNLALAQHMAGRNQEAIPNFEAVLKQDPKSLPALLSLGAARLSLNQPKLAIVPLQKAIALDPKNSDARGMLAGALMDQGQFQEAAAQYRALTDKAPDDPRAWYGLGMSYQGLATSVFDRLQKADPQSPYVAALVAETRVQRRQFRSAFFFYSEALKKLPTLHGIHSALAEVYRKNGRTDWAETEESKERALPPPDCKAHPAECQFIGGKNLDALAPRPGVPSAETLYWQTKAANELAMQALFRLGQLPPSPELHQLRAEIARNQGQHLEAVKEWQEVVKLMPENPRAHQELTISLFMAQDFKAALEAATNLLKYIPKSAELNFIAGDSCLRLEEPEKAVPYLKAALAAEPSMTAANASLGLALSRLGNNKEAVPNLEKALELDDDGSLHYQLARAYQASGDAERARTTMAKYQEILKRNQEQKDEVAREAQIGPPK